MAYQTVQFREPAQVVAAYESREVPAFSIRNKEQMLFTYKGNSMEEGTELLKQFLNLLNDSSGIYSLCIYEQLAEGGRITNKTEYDGSFNFRFQNEIQQQGANYYSRELVSEINALKEEIKQLKDRDEDEPQGNEILGAIGKFIETPPGAAIAGALVEKLMAWISPPQPPQLPGQANTQNLKAVSGITGISLEETTMAADVERLCKCCKDFPALLNKLADLAEKRPFQFSIYAGMLRTLKI